jgi:thioredoxin-related protein
VQDNFDILALNVIGSRKVTDFDGEELSEKQLAAKYGVKFTPTIQFFPTSLDGIKDMTPQQREVIRIPGYLKPDDFLDVFRFVQQRDAGAKTFREFLKLRSG